MPLVRKSGGTSPPSSPHDPSALQALTSPHSEERWMAARSSAGLEGADAALSQALQTEADPRVREAMLTCLARIGSPVAIESLLSMLRSDSAEQRTGALDALRMLGSLDSVASRLLRDEDPDVRILSCELVRSLPAAQSSQLLCSMLAEEQQPNVCAAAIEVLAEVGGPEALDPLSACAARFPDTPFLLFAISSVRDRINAKSARA
ncbi:MAG TPA: HEAT repeat domain-containing protein [Steroidobacteraceae bacterium]|jgi:HEAT repeat protein